MEFILVSCLTLSITANAALLILVRRLKKSPPPQQTYDATALMHDITRGQALVKVIRVDQSEFFLRSPRHQ